MINQKKRATTTNHRLRRGQPEWRVRREKVVLIQSEEGIPLGRTYALTRRTAGLAAVNKQKLVHQDIKPSNVMVSLEEGGAVTAKGF